MSISIVLADDHPLIRMGLRAVFAAEPDFNVVAEGGDGNEVLRLVERLKPDILVLALILPGLGGLEVLPVVRRRVPRTRVVVLSMLAGEEFVVQALKNGADAYVLKVDDPGHVVAGIRAAAAGRRYLSPALPEQAIKDDLEKARFVADDPHELLTPREWQVFQLAAKGKTSPEIAARLHISERTVETHRGNMMRKLALRTQTELVLYALLRGILFPNDDERRWGSKN